MTERKLEENDSASKILAAAVIVIYACGFLITSIHDFQYGFSEMNPFRPRILAAGAWFFVFLAVPFALVRRLTKTDAYRKSHLTGIHRLVNLSWTYILSANFIVWASHPIFAFDAVAPTQPPNAWKITLMVLAFVGLTAVSGYSSKKWPTLNTLVLATYIIGIAGTAVYSFYNQGRFESSSTILWLLGVGLLSAFELTSAPGSRPSGIGRRHSSRFWR